MHIKQPYFHIKLNFTLFLSVQDVFMCNYFQHKIKQLCQKLNNCNFQHVQCKNELLSSNFLVFFHKNNQQIYFFWYHRVHNTFMKSLFICSFHDFVGFSTV